MADDAPHAGASPAASPAPPAAAPVAPAPISAPDAAGRVAWLARVVRDAASTRAADPSRAEHTGAWTRRLEREAPQLAPITSTLHSLASDLRAQQTALLSKLTTQMRVARTVAAEASEQAQQLPGESHALRAALAEAQHAYDEKTPAPHTPEAQALAELHALAALKHRMQAVRDTLQAAESWSRVEGEVDALLAQDDWERAAQRLAGMEQTLANFDASSEYVAAKRALLERLLHTLDVPVARALAEAVAARQADAVVRCAFVYTRVHRTAWFVRHYFAARTAPLLDATRAAPFADVCAALRALATEECHTLGPRVFQEVDAGVDALLAYAVEHMDLRTRLQELQPALPQLVQADVEVQTTVAARAAASHTPQEVHTDAPIPSAALPCGATWDAQLTALLAPYRATYRTREAAYLREAFAATAPAFEARRDRAYVHTADVRPGAWTACIHALAALCRDQVEMCATLWDGACQRAAAVACHADVLDAVHTALLPALATRLCTMLEQVRVRHMRHAHTHAPEPGRVLAEDMDPIPDWDEVHAAVCLMEVAPDLDARLHALHATLLEQSGRDPAVLEAVQTHTSAATPPLDIARAAQAFVLMQLLRTFRMHLEAYSTHGAWRTAPPERINEVRIPSFSKSPTEAMVKLGEGLLNLPRLLETLVERELSVFGHEVDALPYAHDESEPRPSRTSMRTHRALSVSLWTQAPDPATSAAYTAEQVLSRWLRSLTATLLVELQAKLPRMARDARCDRAQLAADLDYLGMIASALNAACPALQEWSQVLTLRPDEARMLPAESPLRWSTAYSQVFS